MRRTMQSKPDERTLERAVSNLERCRVQTPWDPHERTERSGARLIRTPWSEVDALARTALQLFTAASNERLGDSSPAHLTWRFFDCTRKLARQQYRERLFYLAYWREITAVVDEFQDRFRQLSVSGSPSIPVIMGMSSRIEQLVRDLDRIRFVDREHITRLRTLLRAAILSLGERAELAAARTEAQIHALASAPAHRIGGRLHLQRQLVQVENERHVLAFLPASRRVETLEALDALYGQLNLIREPEVSTTAWDRTVLKARTDRVGPVRYEERSSHRRTMASQLDEIRAAALQLEGTVRERSQQLARYSTSLQAGSRPAVLASAGNAIRGALENDVVGCAALAALLNAQAIELLCLLE